MNNIFLIIAGLWLLFGLIACWRDYHGYLKHWYESIGESYWKSKYAKKLAIGQFLFYCIMICFGPIALYTIEKDNGFHSGCWWYNTRNKK